jgi:lysophospholipase L1-like esterase
MRPYTRVLVALALVLGMAGIAPAQSTKENWVGAWAWVPAPAPPGVAPTTPLPPTNIVPLGALPPRSALRGPRIAPRPPLVENPGNVPVDQSRATLANVTLRQVVRVSAAGPRIRLRVSNESGSDVQVLGGIHVAMAGPDGTLVAGSDHVVTFDGQSTMAIPAGAPLLSDPVDMAVKALDRLYVSVFVPGAAVLQAGRTLWSYVAGTPGDFTAETSLPDVRLARAAVFVTGVDVDAPQTNVVVTLGDSITEGDQSTSNAFRSWPDRLAERLAAASGGAHWAVVNAGISGNRVLRTGTGPSALARFDRDVLAVPGAKVVILLEGINDIGRSFGPGGLPEPVTAEALESAYKQIIARAHAHGIRVIGATLAPYKGAFYSSEAGEAVRTAVNNWIKTSGAFDGVIDFAPALADPADPLSFAPQYNDRDHLHPNDAGYQAMANAIDLKLITGR